jgi:signal transduction histidine kinase
MEGPWDLAYAQRRARIGRVHVQIALPQRFMFGAMAVVQTALVKRACERFGAEPARLEAVVVAVGKLVNLELAMMLDTYAESREELVRQIERSRTNQMAALGTMAAGLAHEIRNPLNGALLQLQLVRRRLVRPSGADLAGSISAAELVATELNRLASMVDDFLQFARPHALRLVRGPLQDVIDGVHTLLSEEARALGVELSGRVDGEHDVMIDHERFRQVLINIMQNAMQAAGQGGHVVVRASVLDGTLRIDIEDDGPGLPSPDAPIFEPFYTTKEKGTGLGLSIAHRIVSDHGGRIDVSSRPGRTVFSILVPAGSGSERLPVAP